MMVGVMGVLWGLGGWVGGFLLLLLLMIGMDIGFAVAFCGEYVSMYVLRMEGGGKVVSYSKGVFTYIVVGGGPGKRAESVYSRRYLALSLT